MNITLEEIIKRKIQFRQDNKFLDINQSKGFIRGYSQMLNDINMTEDDFMNKYLKIIKQLNKDYDESVSDDEELRGYNIAIIEILSLLNEKYLFDVSSYNSDMDNL